MLGAANISSTEVMAVFDFLLLVYGIYSIHAARKMKGTGEPPQWLMAVEELKRVRNPLEFCKDMAPKTMVFGAGCILFGIYGIVMSLVFKNKILENIGVLVFLVFIAWFFIALRKAKKKYV